MLPVLLCLAAEDSFGAPGQLGAEVCVPAFLARYFSQPSSQISTIKEVVLPMASDEDLGLLLQRQTPSGPFSFSGFDMPEHRT